METKENLRAMILEQRECRLQVGRIGILSVGWTGNRDGSASGYQATVLGLKLKTIKPSLEEAKSHAEQQARILLKEASHSLHLR